MTNTIPAMLPDAAEGGDVCANAPIANEHDSPTDARNADNRMRSNPRDTLIVSYWREALRIGEEQYGKIVQQLLWALVELS